VNGLIVVAVAVLAGRAASDLLAAVWDAVAWLRWWRRRRRALARQRAVEAAALEGYLLPAGGVRLRIGAEPAAGDAPTRGRVVRLAAVRRVPEVSGCVRGSRALSEAYRRATGRREAA
jgi:hypothetical protein